MFFDHCFFLVLSLQVHAHAYCISFRVKLCADHIIIKTDSHDGSFIRHMWTILFYAKNFGAHFFDHIMIWLNDLVIATVHTVKWIFQTSKYRFLETITQHMNRKNSKCCGTTLANDANIVMTTG